MYEPAIITLQTATLLHFDDNLDDSELKIEEVCRQLVIEIAYEIQQTLPFLPLCDHIDAIIYGLAPDYVMQPVPCYPIPDTVRYLTINGEIVSDEMEKLNPTNPTVMGTREELQAIIAGLQQMRRIA